MKTCTSCLMALPVEAFYLLNTGRPRPTCKRCFYYRTLAYKRANRERRAAHRAVERAVAAGRLTPAKRCVCGRIVRLSAHHEDYARPLDVSWLCGSCHRLRHGKPTTQAAA